jgi:pyruvate dehydrogenase E1 component beta subunit
MGQVPGLKVISTVDPYDTKGLMKSAIRDDNPICFMESEHCYSDVGMIPDEEYLIPIGLAAVKREGKDITIVSYNKMMKIAFAAADELAKEGISAEVIDLRTIRPLDSATIIKSVQKTNRLVVIDESWPFASISSEIAYIVQKHAFDYLDAPISRINSADTSLGYASSYVDAFLPSVERVVKSTKASLYRL